MRYPSQFGGVAQLWVSVLMRYCIEFMASIPGGKEPGDHKLFHIYVLFKVPSTLCLGLTSKRTLQGQSRLNG